jgi:ferredoxin
MVLELSGEEKEFERGVDYLDKKGVKIQPLSSNVALNEARCTQCGACVVICPAGAFHVEPETRYIRFDDHKCIACGFCLKACPPRAMEVRF